jgi:hypothetical protein
MEVTTEFIIVEVHFPVAIGIHNVCWPSKQKETVPVIYMEIGLLFAGGRKSTHMCNALTGSHGLFPWEYLP